MLLNTIFYNKHSMHVVEFLLSYLIFLVVLRSKCTRIDDFREQEMVNTFSLSPSLLSLFSDDENDSKAYSYILRILGLLS